MGESSTRTIRNVSSTLADLLGKEYTAAVCAARAFAGGSDEKTLLALAEERVDFYPGWFQKRSDELLDFIGKRVCDGLTGSARGATSSSFAMATNTRLAPLTGFGFVRIGEDGKAYRVSKSEHYHAPLGHGFPGCRLEKTFADPVYHGRIPVFIVMADNDGGKEANYHGTTVLTQLMRGRWPDFSDSLERHEMMLVKPVSINDLEDFSRLVRKYDAGKYKVAGFFHEIVLMNYGAVRLSEEFLRGAYRICQERDIPTMVDEIQSCIWSPELFLFREYGIRPSFVALGKGFPGGQYPASRILFASPMDNLSQFGALVTNGQEELASLAYLITMEFAQANSDYTRSIGDYYENELRGLERKYSASIEKIEGRRHLSSIFFCSAEKTIRFIEQLNEACIDISAHTYKAKCPPSALTKLPLISSYRMVDFLVSRMDRALRVL